MWPPILKIDRDDCRRKLRRLELESYSSVISVFRAQGSLNEAKVKLLEELRTVFHISPERHRAEARRVANDEQLSTIADSLNSPNSWQEWSREGRRAYPMLPRVAPQTALAIIANNIAAATTAENANLPYPADTVNENEQDAGFPNAKEEAARNGNEIKTPPVVTADPFKMPDTPRKKATKRCNTDSAGTNKKRVPDVVPKQMKQVNSPLGSVATSNMKKTINNHIKHQQQHYEQQQQKPKVATKKVFQGKRQLSPIKSNKKLMKFNEQQVAGHEQLQLALMQSAQQQSQYAANSGGLNVIENSSPVKSEILSEVKFGLSTMPQIAASKKDITKNLTKLQISAAQSFTSPLLITSSSRVSTVETRTSPSSTLVMPVSKAEKQIHSTPVKKYIVEERQPPTTMTGQMTTLPQVLTLPQLSVTPNRLRSVNSTIVQSGSKLTPKKVNTSILGQSTSAIPTINLIDSNVSSGSISASQPQLFNIIDNATPMNPGSLAAPTLANPPIHTPPTVIQLPPNIIANSAESFQQSAQSKVLTAKVVYNGNPANMPKLEGFSNGATIIGTCNTTATSNVFSTVYKTLPTTMIVTGPVHTNASAGIISSMNPNAALYRKPNIIKTSGSATIGKFTTSSSSTQFLANIKLAPAATSTITGSTAAPSSQQFKIASSTSMRPKMKVCQTINGKVYLQPAGNDGSRAKILANFPHKLLTNALGTITVPTSISSNLSAQKLQVVGQNTGNMPGASKMQQRIHHTNQQQKTNTISLGNKNNVIFMPPGGRPTAGHITLAKSSIRPQHSTELGKQNVVVIGPTATGSTLKPATVIANNKIITLPASATNTGITHRFNQMITEDTPVDILNVPYVADGGRGVSIVKSGGSGTNLLADNIAVLSGNLVGTVANESIVQQQVPLEQTSQQRQKESNEVGSNASPAFVDATDWEVELDQATIVAKVQNQQKGEPVNQIKPLAKRLSEEQRDIQALAPEVALSDERCEGALNEGNVKVVPTPTHIEILNGKSDEIEPNPPAPFVLPQNDDAKAMEQQQLVQDNEELCTKEESDGRIDTQEFKSVDSFESCEPTDANILKVVEDDANNINKDKFITSINEKNDDAFLPIEISDATANDVEQMKTPNEDPIQKFNVTLTDDQ